MTHPALAAGSVAVVTGGASGIGLAAARRFLRLGMKVCIADKIGERINVAEFELEPLAAQDGNLLPYQADVGRLEEIQALEREVRNRFGGVDVLMNNAGIQPDTEILGPAEQWSAIFDVNLWGVIHGTQVFAPGMIERGRPGLIINTGSKQGITTPPGNPAYNVAKAGVKAFTEALQHSLRNMPGCQISAHLLIPGFVFTGLTSRGRPDKPAAAWTPEETIDFMLTRLDGGDFYILCPDNEVPRTLDEKRILWAAGDIVENRPPLSRWHADYAEAFATYIKA
jgi:NAD(P)-dependent dehydrogenase (short-subunit alcohol dehydrogenase family)